MGVVIRSRLSKKGIVYILDIHQGGVRHKRALKIDFTLPEKRRRELAEIAAGEARKGLMIDGAGSSRKTRNFIAIFEQYVTGLPRGNNRKYACTLTNLRDHFGNTLLTTHITPEKLESFKRYVKDRYNGETPLTRWRCMMKVINACRSDGLIKASQVQGIRAPKAENLTAKAVLSADELQRMAAVTYPDAYVCKAFLWCCLTGMGRADLMILKWSQIDTGRMQLRYKRAKGGIAVVDLTASAISMLPERIMDRVFIRLPSDSYVHRILNDWAKLAGVDKKLSFYCGRHTFAVLLLEAGTDLLTVSRLLGHTSTKHTEKYLRMTDGLKRKAVDMLPKI